MATEIERVVDAHIHLWDPARIDWYPYLSGRQDVGMSDVSGFSRAFDQDTYFSESAKWNVEKFVHVAAASTRFLVAETMELDGLAQTTGHPDAIVGGIVPTESVAETVRRLDEHLASPRFRGVRSMGFELPSPEVLGALRDRGLVFDLMARPDALSAAAALLADWGDLTVVVEHAGWPRSSSSDEYELWKTGMAALASAGSHVHCKLSGLAMPLQSMAVAVFQPWIEYALEVFGVDRCMFASNFPVDAAHGTFDELYSTYASLTADLDPGAREQLFAANAERVYRC
jgi:L-fuconolactonase